MRCALKAMRTSFDGEKPAEARCKEVMVLHDYNDGPSFRIHVVAAYVPNTVQIATYMDDYQAIPRSLVTLILILRKEKMKEALCNEDVRFALVSLSRLPVFSRDFGLAFKAANAPELISSFSGRALCRYLRGDHIERHDDRQYTDVCMDDGSTVLCSRTVAVIWYLTPDWRKEWGGAFLDLESGEEMLPEFNTLVAFNVPRFHAMPQNAKDQRLFVYYETLANGSHPIASASLDNASGLCFYPTLSCAQQPCCLVDGWVHDAESHSTAYVNYGSMTVYILFTVWLQRWLKKNEADAESQAIPIPDAPSGVPEHLNLLGVYLGVIATVIVGIAMAESTQLALPVPERNSMLAATAFLTPVKDIFQFLEDTTTVKITHAMGVGDISGVRSIFKMGVLGGLACGVVGAALMTLLAYWPTAIEVLLAPGSSQAQRENPGCHLLPSATEVVATARGLWLLTSWSWPFQFVAMVLTGLLMGAREFALFGLANILCQMTLAGTWFFGPKPQDLPLLGFAGFAANVVLVAVMALAVVLN
ncbi:unnamed protein product, partial [Symbiodinium pilosum]